MFLGEDVMLLTELCYEQLKATRALPSLLL